MEAKLVNKCIDKGTLSDLEMIVARVEREAAEFDASCYDGAACKASSG